MNMHLPSHCPACKNPVPRAAANRCPSCYHVFQGSHVVTPAPRPAPRPLPVRGSANG